MGIWNIKITEEEKYEFGTDWDNCYEARLYSGWVSVVGEPRYYLLGEKKISEILSESWYKIDNIKYVLQYEWCNKYDEQNEPYDIKIINNGIQSTLDIKTKCLKKDAYLEHALKKWTYDIDSSQIEKQLDNHYYICCMWNKERNILHILGWIERKEVINLFKNNEIAKGEREVKNLKNESYYESYYEIPIRKLEDMKELFHKLAIDADFGKYDDTDEKQNSLYFY